MINLVSYGVRREGGKIVETNFSCFFIQLHVPSAPLTRFSAFLAQICNTCHKQNIHSTQLWVTVWFCDGVLLRTKIIHQCDVSSTHVDFLVFFHLSSSSRLHFTKHFCFIFFCIWFDVEKYFCFCMKFRIYSQYSQNSLLFQSNQSAFDIDDISIYLTSLQHFTIDIVCYFHHIITRSKNRRKTRDIRKPTIELIGSNEKRTLKV